MRSSLVAALVSCVDRPVKSRARRFLLGLSSDELQFIAGFLGCCILESSEDAIVGTTLDGVVESWNRGAENIIS